MSGGTGPIKTGNATDRPKLSARRVGHRGTSDRHTVLARYQYRAAHCASAICPPMIPCQRSIFMRAGITQKARTCPLTQHSNRAVQFFYPPAGAWFSLEIYLIKDLCFTAERDYRPSPSLANSLCARLGSLCSWHQRRAFGNPIWNWGSWDWPLCYACSIPARRRRAAIAALAAKNGSTRLVLTKQTNHASSWRKGSRSSIIDRNIGDKSPVSIQVMRST